MNEDVQQLVALATVTIEDMQDRIDCEDTADTRTHMDIVEVKYNWDLNAIWMKFHDGEVRMYRVEEVIV